MFLLVARAALLCRSLLGGPEAPPQPLVINPAETFPFSSVTSSGGLQKNLASLSPRCDPHTLKYLASVLEVSLKSSFLKGIVFLSKSQDTSSFFLRGVFLCFISCALLCGIFICSELLSGEGVLKAHACGARGQTTEYSWTELALLCFIPLPYPIWTLNSLTLQCHFSNSEHRCKDSTVKEMTYLAYG